MVIQSFWSFVLTLAIMVIGVVLYLFKVEKDRESKIYQNMAPEFVQKTENCYMAIRNYYSSQDPEDKSRLKKIAEEKYEDFADFNRKNKFSLETIGAEPNSIDNLLSLMLHSLETPNFTEYHNQFLKQNLSLEKIISKKNKYKISNKV